MPRFDPICYFAAYEVSEPILKGHQLPDVPSRLVHRAILMRFQDRLDEGPGLSHLHRRQRRQVL